VQELPRERRGADFEQAADATTWEASRAGALIKEGAGTLASDQPASPVAARSGRAARRLREHPARCRTAAGTQLIFDHANNTSRARSRRRHGFEAWDGHAHAHRREHTGDDAHAGALLRASLEPAEHRSEQIVNDASLIFDLGERDHRADQRTGTLEKTGSGTLTLDGAHLHGPTSISAGRLDVDETKLAGSTSVPRERSAERAASQAR
jgi:autotransporter-associated beta strand protein